MPINLCRHVKMWIHPTGQLPDKIVKRLLFQRKVRPGDSLTFFVNQSCTSNSGDKLAQLSLSGIKVKIIELCLNETSDDKFLVYFAREVLARAAKTQNVRDSVYATDVLRIMKMVQVEGVYSNNDVLFLNLNPDVLLRKQFLFGCHAEGMPDTHIFGIDLNYCDNFYEEVVQKIKDMCGEPPYKAIDLLVLPGLALIPNSINICTYGHLNFPETRANIIIVRDCSCSGGEKKLYALDGDDAVLTAAEDAIKRGYVIPAEFRLSF